VAGLLLGGIAAFGSTRVLRYLLHQVGPRDTLVFGAALALILLASLPPASFRPGA